MRRRRRRQLLAQCQRTPSLHRTHEQQINPHPEDLPKKGVSACAYPFYFSRMGPDLMFLGVCLFRFSGCSGHYRMVSFCACSVGIDSSDLRIQRRPILRHIHLIRVPYKERRKNCLTDGKKSMLPPNSHRSSRTLFGHGYALGGCHSREAPNKVVSKYASGVRPLSSASCFAQLVLFSLALSLFL